MTDYVFSITDSSHAGRLDKTLTQLLPDFSRARLQGLIEHKHVTVNGVAAAKANQLTKLGDLLRVTVPAAVPAIPLAENLSLDIVYEDSDLLIINKAAGMVVHPAAGNADGTLVNALLGHCGDSLSGINGVKRPGIVHRLDKETSGLLVVAKNDTAHNGLAAQFADHSLSRTYMAVVHGFAPASGTIETLIGRDPANRQRQAVVTRNGKEAITHFNRIEVFVPHACLLECNLETGRTHQIRVHMQHLGFPLVGDAVYGKKRGFKNMLPALVAFPRQALHAQAISFTHPRTGKKVNFSSPIPNDIEQLLLDLRATIL